MSARTNVAVSTVASVPASTRTFSGRFFVAGAVDSTAPATVQHIFGMAQFVQIFGPRSTVNGALYDVLLTFFNEGGAEAFVVGVSGTSPNWANALALFNADLGPGAVAVAGVDYTVAGLALTAHASTTNRLALLSAPSSVNTVAAAVTASTACAGLANASTAVFVWPQVNIPTSTGPSAIDPTGFAAGVRASAHSARGPWQSPIRDIYGTGIFISGPAVETTDADWATLNTAGVSVIRTVASRPRLYGWISCASTVATLKGAQFRDLTDSIGFDCNTIAERFVGRVVDGRGTALSDFAGQITGALARYADAGALFVSRDANGQIIDPGYVVDAGAGINSPASLASGILKANVGLRLSPTAEFITINVIAGDAASTL